MTQAVETIAYRPRGPIRDLFGSAVLGKYAEVLIEGPAGTGKSFGVLQWIHQLGKEAPPGTRVLLVRQTLQSMRESIQVTFEDKVLGDDDELRAYLLKGPSRDGRRFYDYPGGMHVALGGMDHPERLYSTEWDVVVCEELVEFSRNDYLRFHRALRNHKLPFQLLLGMTNPKSQYHWLNRRFPAGHRRAPEGADGSGLLRLLSRHEDNPTLRASYLTELAKLPEPLRSQLYLGAWVSASGLVFPQYDEGRHLVELRLERTEDGRAWVLAHPLALHAPLRVKWFGASMDFGYSNPGCLCVWAVLEDNRSVLVREVYHTHWQQEEWAEAIEEIHAELGLRMVAYDDGRHERGIARIIGDSAEPRFLDYLNERLSFARGHKIGTIIRPSDKSRGKIHGLNAVRRALDEDMLAFLHPSARMRHWPDKGIREGAPTCSTEEALSYTYADPERAGTPEAKLKREQSELPDPTSVDHGMDAWEYWATAMYGDTSMDLSRSIPAEKPKYGTAGWVMDLPDSGMRGARRR